MIVTRQFRAAGKRFPVRGVAPHIAKGSVLGISRQQIGTVKILAERVPLRTGVGLALAVEIRNRPVGDLFQKRQGIFAAREFVEIHKAANGLVVSVVRPLGPAGIEEVAIRIDGAPPLNHQVTGLDAHRFVACRPGHAGKSAHPLTKRVARITVAPPGSDVRVAAIPAAEIVSQRAQSRPQAEPLQHVVARNGVEIIAGRVILALHTPIEQTNALVVERLHEDFGRARSGGRSWILQRICALRRAWRCGSVKSSQCRRGQRRGEHCLLDEVPARGAYLHC